MEYQIIIDVLSFVMYNGFLVGLTAVAAGFLLALLQLRNATKRVEESEKKSIQSCS
jgi:energy-converting hydrogenase Eha subunit E